MFVMLHREVAVLICDPAHFLDQLPAIYDWSQLGCFTGSRLGEYGQSKPKLGKPFATVPHGGETASVLMQTCASHPQANIKTPYTILKICKYKTYAVSTGSKTVSHKGASNGQTLSRS